MNLIFLLHRPSKNSRKKNQFSPPFSQKTSRICFLFFSTVFQKNSAILFSYAVHTCTVVYLLLQVDLDFFGESRLYGLVRLHREALNGRSLEASAKKNFKYYPCCAEPYPDLTFGLKANGDYPPTIAMCSSAQLWRSASSSLSCSSSPHPHDRRYN